MAGEETSEAAETPTLESLFEDDDTSEAEQAETESKETGEESETEEETEETEESGDTETEEETAESTDEDTENGASPASDDKRQSMVEATALLQERRRRQAAEEKLRKYEDAEALENAPDPTTEPDEYKEFLAKRDSSIEWNTRVELSREHQMEIHDDYVAVEAQFMDLITDDEGQVVNHQLAAQMRASKDPAKFVYDYMGDFREAETWTDPKKREAAINAAVEKKVAEALEKAGVKPGESETEAKPTKPDGVAADEVPELTSAAAAGGAKANQREPEATFEDAASGSPLDQFGNW